MKELKVEVPKGYEINKGGQNKLGLQKNNGDKYSNEWYTPKYFFDAFPEFDLDPCAPITPLWNTAKKMYNINDNGLTKEWRGTVWLNPPYERKTMKLFMDKMIEHNDGIALLFNRLDSRLFQSHVLGKASSILFIKGRIKFYKPDGTQGDSSNVGSILVSYGDKCKDWLEKCNISGVIVEPKKVLKIKQI
mgnify:FL=1